ncbi:hypothetical protein BCD64_23325 [Nostoc sp. MBR 210]|nr:hypothetical protein BCD64_23325 [Nostoc sp. MBR 210]
MPIISVPTIYSCHLPSGGWLNLALVRQLEIDDGIARITWSNGNVQNFQFSEDVDAIAQAWQQAAQKTGGNYESSRD